MDGINTYFLKKICDFGLSRRIGPYDTVALSWDDMPFRWMASESLQHPYVFSQSSDCWMFGITVVSLMVL